MNAKPLNFEWQALRIATGGKPGKPEHLCWLKEQNIGAIVSLEPIPDQIEKQIRRDKIPHLQLDIDSESSDEPFNARDHVSDSDWQKFTSFISLQLSRDKVVYVHCSAGISRSYKMVLRFLNEKSPTG